MWQPQLSKDQTKNLRVFFDRYGRRCTFGTTRKPQAMSDEIPNTFNKKANALRNALGHRFADGIYKYLENEVTVTIKRVNKCISKKTTKVPIYFIRKNRRLTDYVLIATEEVTPVLFPRNVSARPKQKNGLRKLHIFSKKNNRIKNHSKQFNFQGKKPCTRY